MKQLKHISSPGSFEEIAMDIISEGGTLEYWAEYVINAGGNAVNVEVVVTFVNGYPYGKQYVSNKSLPAWKQLIKRFLKI